MLGFCTYRANNFLNKEKVNMSLISAKFRDFKFFESVVERALKFQLELEDIDIYYTRTMFGCIIIAFLAKNHTICTKFWVKTA